MQALEQVPRASVGQPFTSDDFVNDGGFGGSPGIAQVNREVCFTEFHESILGIGTSQSRVFQGVEKLLPGLLELVKTDGLTHDWPFV